MTSFGIGARTAPGVSATRNPPDAATFAAPAPFLSGATRALLSANHAEVLSDPEHISTGYVERQNLNMRMNMRRFTRLTNAFSKKVDNLRYSVAIHFMHYNFCRVHQTLRVTPAMEAGVADHIWTVAELVSLLETKLEIAA